MFDIGQNDLAGAFYSKTFDQIVASIPNILVEFETGIKVSSYFRPFLSFRFLTVTFLQKEACMRICFID